MNTPVAEGNRFKDSYMATQTTNLPEDHSTVNFSSIENIKQANTACYYKRMQGRMKHNSRAEHKRIVSKPHGLEDDYPEMHSGPGGLNPSLAGPAPVTLPTIMEEPETESPESVSRPEEKELPPSLTEERNNLVHLATTTPPQSKDTSGSSELTDRKSVV